MSSKFLQSGMSECILLLQPKLAEHMDYECNLFD